MKVLIVKTNPFQPEGITSVVMNYFRAMEKADIQMDIVGVGTSAEVYIREIMESGGKFFTLNRSIRHPLQYIRSLSRIIRQEGYDAIHVHGNSCTMTLELCAAALEGCKVRIVHSHNTTCKYGVIHKLLKPLFYTLCTHRLACGAEAGRWLYGKRDFTVLRNGIEIRRFGFSPASRREIRQAYGISEKRRLIGHVGRFNEAKNQRFLVELLQVLTAADYGLLLIGHGELRAEVENLAQKLGVADRILFIGETDRVTQYLSACDLLVMPSLFEGLPLTLVEAQANGLPCVASENITREVDMTGNVTFLPLEKGAEFWADKIQQLQLPADRQAASEAACEKIKKHGYDIQTEAQMLKEYYRKAIEG